MEKGNKRKHKLPKQKISNPLRYPHKIYTLFLNLSAAMPIVQSFFPPPYYEWWVIDDGKYVGCDKTLQKIRELEARSGPFEAVLGFSQGGCLAAILAVDKVRSGDQAVLSSLKCAVILSGFLPVDPHYAQLFESVAQRPEHASTSPTKCDEQTANSVHRPAASEGPRAMFSFPTFFL